MKVVFLGARRTGVLTLPGAPVLYLPIHSGGRMLALKRVIWSVYRLFTLTYICLKSRLLKFYLFFLYQLT